MRYFSVAIFFLILLSNNPAISQEVNQRILHLQYQIEKLRGEISDLRNTLNNSPSPIGRIESEIEFIKQENFRIETKFDQRTIPAGAILIWNNRDCPAGYRTYANARGKFIIGHSDTPLGPNLGISANFNEEGGTAEIVLDETHMPPHGHVLDNSVVTTNAEGRMRVSINKGPPEIEISNITGAAPDLELALENDGNIAFSNMPPFLALTFCEKT